MDVLQAVEELSKVGGINKILVAENDAYGSFLAGIVCYPIEHQNLPQRTVTTQNLYHPLMGGGGVNMGIQIRRSAQS